MEKEHKNQKLHSWISDTCLDNISCPSAVDVTIGNRIYINLNRYLFEKYVYVHSYIYQSFSLSQKYSSSLHHWPLLEKYGFKNIIFCWKDLKMCFSKGKRNSY